MEELIKHHSFSPSKLERIISCPPSWKICLDYVQQDNKDNIRGTLMHKAIYDDNALSKLNDTDKETILNIRKEYIEPFQTDDYDIYYEEQVTVCNDKGVVITSGTADIFIMHKTKPIGSLIDCKFGNHEVTEPKLNPQLKTYSVGFFQKFIRLETIYTLILQPCYGIGDYENQDIIQRSDCPAIINEIEIAEEKAKNADLSDLNQYHCTPDNCRFCNKFACIAYKNWMNHNMQLIGVEDIPKEIMNMTVDYADRVKCASKAIEAQMETLVSIADKVILENGGSANFSVCSGRITKKTDWKKLCLDNGISSETIEQYTTESVGNPYLKTKMRKKRNLLD